MKNWLFPLLLLCTTASNAAPRIGHHGDWVVQCHKPMFFAEVPVEDAHVAAFQEFEFKASANTDVNTLKVWVNNRVHDVSIEKRPSGNYRIAGKFPQPLQHGKAWIKVTAESDDGCNALRAWNVYIQ